MNSVNDPHHPRVNATGANGANLADAYLANVSAAATAVAKSISASAVDQIKTELRAEFREQIEKERLQLEEKIAAMQRTQEVILELLRQEPQ